jgi:streptomycin 6-kinase
MEGFPSTIGPGIDVPDRMIQRLINWQGRETTKSWFSTVEPRLAAWCDEWEITIEQRELPDTVSLVLFGESPRAGPVVLKIGPPDFERNAEIAATREAAGPGMVRMIAADPTLSIVMLERLSPGTELAESDLDDADTTHIVAQRLRAFWREPADPTGLIPLERWTKELRQFTPHDQPGFPNDLVLRGQSILESMLATPTSASLLHGDMHHHNILWRDGYGWTTIDPKGLIGERGFDITAWMMNPWGHVAETDFLVRSNRRLDILADTLGEDRARLANWCLVFAALNLCWSLDVEQPEDPAQDIAILETMSQLVG